METIEISDFNKFEIDDTDVELLFSNLCGIDEPIITSVS